MKKSVLLMAVILGMSGCAHMSTQSGRYLQFADHGKVFMQIDLEDSAACQNENNLNGSKNGITAACSLTTYDELLPVKFTLTNRSTLMTFKGHTKTEFACEKMKRGLSQQEDAVEVKCSK